jgi:Tfp pilus assembly protein PilN
MKPLNFIGSYHHTIRSRSFKRWKLFSYVCIIPTFIVIIFIQAKQCIKLWNIYSDYSILKEHVSQQKNILTEKKAVIKKQSAIDTKLTLLKTWNTQLPYDILSTIAKNAPASLLLTHFSLNSNKQIVQMAGYALSIEDITSFFKDLAKSPLFSSITLKKIDYDSQKLHYRYDSEVLLALHSKEELL